MSFRCLVRVGVLALAVPSLLLGVAACSSGPVSHTTPATASASPSTAGSGASSAPASAGPTAGASASPTVSESPLAAASGQLTGTELQTVLLPQSYFPAGYTLSSSSAVTSGGSLETAPATYNLATVSCSNFVQHLGDTGFGESAMASDSFASASGNQAFDQVVYQFAGAATASMFVSGIQSLAARCATFTATDNGSAGTFSMKAAAGPPVGGHPSVDLQQTGTISGSSVALDTLFTASGVDVFGVASVGLGAAAPTNPSRQALGYTLMKRQAAAAVLG